MKKTGIKTLSFAKETVSNLNGTAMGEVLGGYEPPTDLVTRGPRWCDETQWGPACPAPTIFYNTCNC